MEEKVLIWLQQLEQQSKNISSREVISSHYKKKLSNDQTCQELE